TSGGALVTADVDFGFAWQITGDGSANPRSRITQSVYQDSNFVPILLGDTDYTFQAWIAASGTTGSVVAEIYSAGSGVLATATIALSGAGTLGKFYTPTFSVATPTTIPADAVLRVYAVNQANAQTATIDECGIFPTMQPQNSLLRLSYADENPEAFDGVTGLLGSTQDPTPVV